MRRHMRLVAGVVLGTTPFAACASTVIPLEHEPTSSVTIDGRLITPDSGTARIDYDGILRVTFWFGKDQQFRAVRFAVLHAQRSAASYYINNSAGSATVTKVDNTEWVTKSPVLDCDCLSPDYGGTFTVTYFDQGRITGVFNIYPSAHRTTGSFDLPIQ